MNVSRGAGARRDGDGIAVMLWQRGWLGHPGVVGRRAVLAARGGREE